MTTIREFAERLRTSFMATIDRLLRDPIMTKRYRAHWRILCEAHPLILALLRDDRTGERARNIMALWLSETARDEDKRR